MAYTPPSGDAVDFALVEYTVPDGNAVNFEFAVAVIAPFLLGFGISGRIGKEGDADPLGVNGIWQMRMTKKGKVPVKMKFYSPINPQTPAQQANRAKFTAAMSAWGALTTEEKLVYTTRAKRRNMFGWGLFIREYYSAN